MNRQLLLLRHAKSDWDSEAETDFERPLSKRGKRDAPLMGRWLFAQGLVPDLVVSSPAKRARKTARRVCKALGLDKAVIRWDNRIYGAELGDLLSVLQDCPEQARLVMLVGHNPGLDGLLSFLRGHEAAAPEGAALLSTAAVAHLDMPRDWTRLDSGCARLVALTRPADVHPEAG